LGPHGAGSVEIEPYGGKRPKDRSLLALGTLRIDGSAVKHYVDPIRICNNAWFEERDRLTAT
jgi:hypothetical protein